MLNATPTAAGCVCLGKTHGVKIISYCSWGEKVTWRHDYNLGLLDSLLEEIKQQGNSLPSIIDVYIWWIYHTFESAITILVNMEFQTTIIWSWDQKNSNKSLFLHTTNEDSVWSISNTSIMAYWVYNMTHFISLIIITVVRLGIVRITVKHYDLKNNNLQSF